MLSAALVLLTTTRLLADVNEGDVHELLLAQALSMGHGPVQRLHQIYEEKITVMLSTESKGQAPAADVWRAIGLVMRWWMTAVCWQISGG